jgi:hypothetical protein
VVCACGIILAPARGIGEGIVCVIYELKLAGSFGAFWGFVGNTVRVGFECCSVILLVRVKFGGKEREGTTFCRHRGFAAELL